MLKYAASVPHRSFPIRSWRRPPSTRPMDGATWPPWRRPPTSGEPNRQVLTWGVRQELDAVLGERDVSRRLRRLAQPGQAREARGGWRARKLLCVHRKGATRALAGRHPDLPDVYRPPANPSCARARWALPRTCLSVKPGNQAFRLDLSRRRKDHEPAPGDADGARRRASKSVLRGRAASSSRRAP